MPNGPRLLTKNSKLGVRNTQERSDVEFFEGRNTDGIIHNFQANNRGLIGPDENYFPTTQEGRFIPHRAIKRMRVGQGAPPRGNPVISDETAFVPAWAIGDPR